MHRQDRKHVNGGRATMTDNQPKPGLGRIGDILTRHFLLRAG